MDKLDELKQLKLKAEAEMLAARHAKVVKLLSEAEETLTYNARHGGCGASWEIHEDDIEYKKEWSWWELLYMWKKSLKQGSPSQVLFNGLSEYKPTIEWYANWAVPNKIVVRWFP